MTSEKHPVYDDASTVAATDGAVELDGPDAVDVAMTPKPPRKPRSGWRTRRSRRAASAA